MKISVVDFETKEIESRPVYPPEPVGVAVEFKGKKQYLAWGHPTENNCSKQEAKKFLKKVYKESDCIYFHHAYFDIYVGKVHLDLPYPKRYHDSMILAYLHDPREDSLALKPLADKYLDMPPEEQTKLKNWILANIPAAKKKPSTWGAYISEAPGKLVGKYAIGDIIRTKKLVDAFLPYVIDCEMEEAYEREKALTPIIEEQMTSQGVRVDVKRLDKDVLIWQGNIEKLDRSLRKKLKCSKEVNLNSSQQLADVLDSAGLVDEWIMTEPTKNFPEGQRSTKRENLVKVCNDKSIVSILDVKSRLETCLNTFGIPWLETASENEGYIFPEFNSIRSTDEYGGRGKGTRTGRFSSSNPNLQNVPNVFEDIPKIYAKYMPAMRDYLIPDKYCVLIGRDYSQQELRILAHYEDGLLLQRYNEDPNLDVHELLRQLIYENTGILYERKFVKITGFGIIYGMGLEKLGNSLGISKDEASILRSAYYTSLPGIKELSQGLKKLANNNEPIRTWGGREYFVEEPKRIGNMLRTFEYKLLNLLIQGSAADCTKEAMLRYDQASTHGRLTIQVHDELLVNTPKEYVRKEMKLLQECMESVEFDLPMLSDGKKSSESWYRMQKYEV